MALNSIEELVEDIRQGKMVILMDDEDRENEGDIIMAAESGSSQKPGSTITESFLAANGYLKS